MLVVLNWGKGETFPLGNICQYVQTFLVVITGRSEWSRVLLASSREKPGMLFNVLYYKCTKQPSTTKEYQTQNINSIEVGKTWLMVMQKEDILGCPKSLDYK